MTAGDRTEQRLAELASYHVGLFVGVVSREPEVDFATIAHALFVLAREAERRRKEWLATAQMDRELDDHLGSG